MSDRDAFLAAIRAAPDDDAPRLVYADWLDEQGDADLAEFIRLQIEIEPFRRLDGDLDRYRRAVVSARLDDPVPADFPPGLHRFAVLARRERDLLKARRWDWLAPLAAVDEDNASHLTVTFRRGLAEEVGIATSAFLESGDAVREACPALRRITLFGPRDQVPELVASTALGGIPELELAGWITEHDARFLTIWLAFNPVRSLRLWVGSRADSAVIQLLATGPTAADPGASVGRSPRLTTESYLGDLRELILVQLHGGLLAGDRAEQLSARAIGLAATFDEFHGRSVARLEQPFARRFPLAGQPGRGLYAGHLAGGPALVCAGLRLDLIRFNSDGQMIDERPLDLTAGRPAVEKQGPPELLRVLRDELGFLSGPVFVREFAAAGPGVSVYQLGTYEDVVADPDGRSDGDEHEEACASLHRYWMEGGNFVVYSGTDYWAGPDGTIHSS